MARSIECRCESRFTCGHCLRNMKPYFYGLSDGSAIAVSPPQGASRCTNCGDTKPIDRSCGYFDNGCQ